MKRDQTVVFLVNQDLFALEQAIIQYGITSPHINASSVLIEYLLALLLTGNDTYARRTVDESVINASYPAIQAHELKGFSNAISTRHALLLQQNPDIQLSGGWYLAKQVFPYMLFCNNLVPNLNEESFL